MGYLMTISPEMLAALCTLAGSIGTGVLTGLYWLLKCRKDIDAAHEAIRELRLALGPKL
jgi:hypothetical protein